MLRRSALLRVVTAAASSAALSSASAASASPSPSPHRLASAQPVSIPLLAFREQSPQEQKEALRLLIRNHEAAVQRNSLEKDAHHSTYDQNSCSYFRHYQLASLPPTSGGGAHRASVRAALAAHDGPLRELEEDLLKPWRGAGERAVVVFGAKSVPYVRRQLSTDEAHTFLVVDHSLKSLANMAAALVKDYGPRVHFLRADAMFTVLSVLPRESVDTVVVPMPAPFWSGKGSYRRLVTSDFVCAVHRVIRERADVTDPRGFVAFTDCEPYADFIVEQLTEAKLIVPWTRKNPQEAYGRWLPVATTDDAAAAPGEFTQQRFREVVAVAASKSGPTSGHALSFIERFSYKRRYYRAFNDGSQRG